MAAAKKKHAPESVEKPKRTPEQRIAQLLDVRFHGNRSTMGKAIGFSHAAISRVVTGKACAGPRLLDAIAARLEIDKQWLLTGEGNPGIEMGVQTALTAGHPVVRDLSQLTRAKGELPADDWLNLSAKLTNTQYWLRVPGQDLLVSSKRYGFRAGDLLLLETDPERIAKEQPFANTLCVVASGRKTTPSYRLAFAQSADEDMPGRVHMDYVDNDIPASERVDEFIVESWSTGKPTVRHRTRRVQRGKVKRLEADADYGFGPDDLTVGVSDIVAIWTGIMYRRGTH